MNLLRLLRHGTWLTGAVVPSLFVAGCASTPPANPPLSDSLRDGLGTIGIVSLTDSSAMDYELPSTRHGAAIAAAESAATATLAAPTVFGALTGGPGGAAWGAATGLALAPVTTTAGLAYGALTGESASKLRAASPPVLKVLTGLQFERELSLRLLQEMAEHHIHRALLCPALPLDTTLEAPTYKNRYRYAAEQGVDSVIEIVASGVFEKGQGMDQKLTLHAQASLTVIDVHNGVELYSDHGEYRGKGRRITEWAKDDARPLKAEFEQCYQRLNRRMVRQLFSGVP